jgi:hypothetical protein
MRPSAAQRRAVIDTNQNMASSPLFDPNLHSSRAEDEEALIGLTEEMSHEFRSGPN